MERILLESQSQNNLMKNSNKSIDIDKLNDSEFKMKNLYSMKNGISISTEEMLQLKNGEFIASVVVNYFLRKTIQNENIYVFETLESETISKEDNSSIRNNFQDAMLYPIWFISIDDKSHFTLFIIHTIHQRNSFEKSCVLYFNSLVSFKLI